jgi:hypothetical protein
MLDSSRFIDERLSSSITSLIKPDNPIDGNEPLTFQAWLQYNNALYTNANDFLLRYQSYLNNWYEAKNTVKASRADITRSLYTTLINEIVLTFTSSDEKRFLKNIDVNNSRDLAVAIPFFAQKIKEICLYYSTLRDDVKTGSLRYNLKGSNLGVEKLIYNEISKSLETEDLTDLTRSLAISLSSIRDNMVVDVEDLYDTYTSYLDVSPTVPASAYGATNERKEFFSLNQYEIDPNLFLDFDYTIVDAITSYPFFLTELGTNNFNITPQVDATQLQYLKDADFINTINTQQLDNLNLNLTKSAITKYIGTDFYYISTNSTSTNYISGILFSAENEFANYLNKRYPAVAAIADTAFTKTAKEIGLFFKPDKIGLSNFHNFGLNFEVNPDALSANTLYIFPDPSKYGNISGLTEEEFLNPLSFTELSYFNKIDFSNQFRFGDSETNSYYQTFRSYQSREQTLDTSLQGIAKYTDPQEFFQGDLRSIWANKDLYPVVPQNKFPLDNRIEKLVSLGKTVVQYKNDIYGNEFSLYKDVHPIKAASNDKVNNTNAKLIYCLTVDGHLFFDSVSGYNFDYNEVDVEKNYSGIVLKTTTNIPPGTGFYLPGPNIFNPTPLSASFYDNGAPMFALTGAVLPLVSYRYQLETFCPSRIDVVFLCSTMDGVTFVSPSSGLLPDYPSDEPTFNPQNANVYYMELVDGGSTPLEPNFIPNFVNPAEFSYTPPLSAITDVDGSIFVYNSASPCGDALDFVVSYTEPSNYLNYHIPLRNTKVIEGLSGLDIKRTIYQTKYVDYGALYYRNSNSTIILPGSAALSGLLIKYNTEINNEIVNNLINFDVYYDTIQFETENYVVFDKIKFDYETNTILNTTKNDLFFQRGDNKDLEKISTVWFNEAENILFVCRTVLYPQLSATNNKIVYPEIYSLNLGTLELNRLFPTIERSLLTFDDLKQFSLSGAGLNVNIVKIEKPLFAYDSDTGTYSITYLGKDLSDGFYIIKTFFKYVNGVITNITNTLFKLMPETDTLNFAGALSSSYTTYTVVGSGPGSIIDGAFTFE